MAKYKDADELLKRLNSCKYPAEKTTRRQATYNAAISDACRIVDAIPDVDVVEVRHGRWEDVEHAPNGLLYATCSACGKRQTIEAVNYCGNCGARMEVTE